MTGSDLDVIRIPRSPLELDEATRRARRMVTKRALASAGAVLVPIPGLDIAADIALLTQLIPAINREFGLTQDQIERLNPRLKALVYRAIVAFGGAMVGRVVTRELVMQALATVGMRITTKTAARFVPVAGQALSAGVSFSAMKLVGEYHVRDCRRVIEALMQDRWEGARNSTSEAPATNGPSAVRRLRFAAARAVSRLRRMPRG